MDPSLRALIEQAEFKESFRGYDRAQVDDALEQLASRAGKLEAELIKATERMATMTSQARADAEAEVEPRVQAEIEARMAVAAPHEQEAAEEVRLTIVMAQRTADAAIREARAEADQLVAAAREEADRTIAEARADATREREDARQRLVGEIRELESARDALGGHVQALEHHVERQRDQVAAVVDHLRRLLDDPTGLHTDQAPSPPQITVPEPEPSPDQQGPGGSDAEPDQAAPSAGGETGAVGAEGDDGPGIDEASPADSPAVPVDDAAAAVVAPEGREAALAVTDNETGEADGPAPSEEHGATETDIAGPVDLAERVEAHGGPDVAVEIEVEPAPDAPRDHPLTPAFDAGGVVDHAGPGIHDGGPPAESVDHDEQPAGPPSATSRTIDEDPFLAELRKAMTDDEPLGPRDPPLARPARDDSDAGHDGDSDDPTRHRSRFGRRR